MTDEQNTEFETWWEKYGQYCRSGGGEYEKSFSYATWEHCTEQARSTIAAPAENAGDQNTSNQAADRANACSEAGTAAPAQEPEGYTDEWILEQFRRTLILLDEKEPLVKALRIFGNRVLMQFGDSEGMHRAFSEAYERDKAERSAAPASTAAPVVPEGEEK